MAGAQAYEHWDLGSNPRSPKILFAILFQAIPCSIPSRAHHTPLSRHLPSGFRSDPLVRAASSSYSLVNACAWEPGKSTRLDWIWASNLLSPHSNQAHTPLGLFLFSFIFLFYFNCFINYLLLLTNLFFLIKIIKHKKYYFY